MRKTKIEWCDATVNPVVGCTFGCPYCYAKRFNDRFGFVEDFTKPQFFPERLRQLYEKEPRTIFMDSMSDFADWKDEWKNSTYGAMIANPQHTYLFLTKRPYEALSQFLPVNCLQGLWFGRVWMGLSVTDVCCDSNKIRDFYQYNPVKNLKLFVSVEPLMGDSFLPFAIDPFLFYGINWVIIGAETGNRKGKIIPKKLWVDRIVEACKRYGIPVFMKESLLPIMGKANMLQESPVDLRRFTHEKAH